MWTDFAHCCTISIVHSEQVNAGLELIYGKVMSWISKLGQHLGNLFHTTGLFYTPGKHQKTNGFLIFSGGLEREQWHEMR